MRYCSNSDLAACNSAVDAQAKYNARMDAIERRQEERRRLKAKAYAWQPKPKIAKPKPIPMKNPFRLADIMREVCDQYGITIDQMRGACRVRQFVIPRQEAMYRCKKETTATLWRIAQMFDRDHTTVIHGIRCHEKRLEIAKKREAWSVWKN